MEKEEMHVVDSNNSEDMPDTNIHSFTIPYSDLNLEVYNEEYFKNIGLEAEVSVVIPQTGGGYSYPTILKMEENDNKITVPYKFFHYRLKYLFGEPLNGSFGSSGEDMFTKTMEQVSVYGKYIMDTVDKQSYNVKSSLNGMSKSNVFSKINFNKVPQNEVAVKPEPQPEPEPEPEPQHEPEPDDDISKKDQANENEKPKDDRWNWLYDFFKLDNKNVDGQQSTNNVSTHTNGIKIVIHGVKSKIDVNEYQDIVQYVRIIHNLHIKHLSIQEIETIKINDKIVIIGNIEKKEEPTMEVFKRGAFSELSINKIENTEAHKLLLF